MNRSDSGGSVDLSDAELATAKPKLRAAWREQHADTPDSEMPAALRAAEAKLLAAARQGAAMTTTESLWFAEQRPNGFLVALWLSSGTAEQLAIAGGEPAESLHVTLCWCGDVAELDELTLIRAISAVDREVTYRTPIEGRVSGYGRFTASETSDAQDVFYASVDSPDLAYLRQCIADALTSVGCPPRASHGYTPHCTLAYLEPGAPNPVDSLPSLPLRFSAVTIMAGERRIDIPMDGFYPSIYSTASKGGSWRLFNALPAAFADAPAWINVMPKPGTYMHPTYGSFSITPERNQRFVQNFEDQIYQRDIPITLDIEHDGRMSGAVGYFAELRLNGDGSIDARVEWTDVGTTLLAEDRFKYFSPEWWDRWNRPGTDLWFDDVLIGGAICTRPYFKENVLAPLVASEGQFYVPDRASGQTVQLRQEAAVAGKESGMTDKSITLTEDEVKQLREQAAKNAALEQTLSDQAKQLSEQAEAKQASDQKIAALEAEAQTKRFTDLVMGRGGGGDGAVFVGEVAANVESLVSLAEAFGEDSDKFKAEVALRQATAKTLKASDAFKPIGSSESGEGGSAWDQVDTKAQALRATEPTLTIEQARERVMAAEPELKRRVYHEERGETRRG